MSANQTQTRHPKTVLGKLYIFLTPNERRNFRLRMVLVLLMAAFSRPGAF